MARFSPPRCKAPDPDGRGTCDVPMQPMGERHPNFGPNYHPGGWVFECRRCGAIRFIDEQKVAQYTERTRA